MKNLFAVFFVLILSNFNFFYNDINTLCNSINSKNVENVFIYSSGIDKNNNIDDKKYNVVYNGVNNIYKISFSELKQEYVNETFCGVEFFVNNFNFEKFLIRLNAKIVKTEIICERAIIYAYSNKLEKSVRENNRNINLQICISNNYMVIGYPLLLGSY